MRALIAVLLVAAVAGCGSSHQQTRKPSIAAGDKEACAHLFARLQQVSAAIQGSSELIANSLNEQQLSERIAYEQSQLQQAAALMGTGPIPAALRDTNNRLVAALRTLTADFERARDPAARGDFRTAAAAMTDQAAVRQIVAAAKSIEEACK